MSNQISVEVDAALYFSCDNMLTKIIDIYDKKDKMNQIQLFFFGKNVKN